MQLIAKVYEHIINLEALDRRLGEDIKTFASHNDQLGIDIAKEARRAAQNDMFAFQQIYDNLRNKKEAQ